MFLDYTSRVAVKEESHFTAIVKYINNNPVHHGFCNKPELWKYSSYNNLLTPSPDSFLEKDEIMNWFGGKDNFIRMFKEDTKALLTNRWVIENK